MANRTDADAQHHVEPKTATEARQGVTGHNVRYVLGISLGAIVVLFAILWVGFFKM